MTYRIEKLTVEAERKDVYRDFELPEGAIVLRSYIELDVVVLYVATPNQHDQERSKG